MRSGQIVVLLILPVEGNCCNDVDEVLHIFATATIISATLPVCLLESRLARSEISESICLLGKMRHGWPPRSVVLRELLEGI